MPKKNVEAIYQLSPSQQGMLFETLSSSASGIHIEQSVSHIHGDINPSAFEQAWQRIMDRHPILRTAFVWRDQDEPLQVVLQGIKAPLEWQDCRRFPPDKQQELLDGYLREARFRGFELAKAPLLKLAMFRTGDNEYHFTQSIHHILVDGWSRAIIMKEFLELYEAFHKNQDLTLEPCRPYRDYITWLRRQDLSLAELFWRDRLKGITRPTPLGIKRVVADYEESYGVQITSLPSTSTEALKSLAKQNHVTLNTLIQSVWALLLSRYSGELDVVLGATVSGRPADLPGVESIVGPFLNTLPVRIQVNPEVSLWNWARDIQTQQVAQKAYEYCSSGQIHQWSELPGSLPIYESVLVFENYPIYSSSQELSSLGIDMRAERSIGAQTRYTATILIYPGTEIKFKLVYNKSRIDETSANLIMEQFIALLENITAVPEQNLKNIMSSIPSEQVQKISVIRGDDRVKSLSNHVEVGELSAALVRHPDVKEAIVIAQKGDIDSEQLVAYVVPQQGRFPNINKLRRFLQKELSGDILPDTLVILDVMPVAPDGKVDISGLPAPKMARPELGVDFVAPRDELEIRLAEIWEETLGITPIGIKDDFFQLGKHSLVAMSLFAHIQRLFGKDLPMTTLFQAPTIEQLANVMRQKETSTPWSSMVTIQTGGSKPPFFFIHGCGGEVFFTGRLATYLGSDQPFYGLRARGVYGEKPPHNSIEEMAADYIEEIRKIQPRGPYFIGSAGGGSFVVYEIAQQLLAQSEKIGLLILIDAILHERPFQTDSPARNMSNITGLVSSVKNQPKPTASRKGLVHYIRRSFYHLWHGQLKRIITGKARVKIEKYRWRFAYSFIARRFKFIQRRINYVEHVIITLSRATRRYKPKVYPGYITYFLAEWRKNAFESDWYQLAGGGIDIHIVPGHHTTIWKEPNVHILAERLKACLNEAQLKSLGNNHHDGS